MDLIRLGRHLAKPFRHWSDLKYLNEFAVGHVYTQAERDAVYRSHCITFHDDRDCMRAFSAISVPTARKFRDQKGNRHGP